MTLSNSTLVAAVAASSRSDVTASTHPGWLACRHCAVAVVGGVVGAVAVVGGAGFCLLLMLLLLQDTSTHAADVLLAIAAVSIM